MPNLKVCTPHDAVAAAELSMELDIPMAHLAALLGFTYPQLATGLHRARAMGMFGYLPRRNGSHGRRGL
jgi:hypothetical protein